ncbi:hypothetical protein J2Z69_001626 [Paenibacillus shirakamiensis]|uniref:DUF3221 domain-containing protein n=1 Tax=Paenibacillus shirakamiensis TaxID=1265935 RepID=A0ABS4JFU8_9BACL|nr:hypothetical protein [Paenibacillus shirakamiensis]MBP2000595.1 hypothetical protein [Paenibacillus shirakamiensis]
MKKKIIYFLMGVVVLLLVGFAKNRLTTYTVNPDIVVVNKIMNTDHTLALSGDLISSATQYEGYTARKVGDKLYLSLQANDLIYLGKRDGSFQITLQEDGQSISEIYLTQDSYHKKIWPAL